MAIINSGVWNTRSLNIFDNYYALPTQFSPLWGTFLTDKGISDQGLYEFDIRFQLPGRQLFATSSDDAAQLYIDGEFIGLFGDLNDYLILRTDTYYDPLSVHRISIVRTDGGIKPTAVACEWVANEYTDVEIVDFSATPNPVIGSRNTTLLWTVNNARKIEINQNVGDVTGLSQKFLDTGLQSIEGTRSPATKIYTLTAYGNVPSDIITDQVEVSVFNDNTPSDITIPNFYNLNPNETVTYSLQPLAGIDVPITVAGGGGLVAVTTGTSESYTTSVIAQKNDVVKIRFTSPPFNPDPLTLDNTVEYYIDVGTIRKYFTVTTRAAEDLEQFDFGNIDQAVPYPVPPGNDENPPPYLVSPDIVEPTAAEWEVEFQDPDRINLLGGVEIKTTYNDKAEVRVKPFGGNWGSWINTEYLYDQLTVTTPRTLENMNWSNIGTRSGSVSNPQPKLVNTRISGVLTGKNIT